VNKRLWLAAVSVLAIAGLGWLGLPYRGGEVPEVRPLTQRPTLALLTSLPLLFGEKFSLEGNGSPALARLEQRYNVIPIGVADTASLKEHRLLLMAHPRAQPAEALVELDQWVRDGGRLLLLADPKLDWPSELPMGDVLRPPPMFADTGLLKHWGLTLNAPDVPGPIHLGGGHNPVVFLSAGRLASTNTNCELYRADIIAECAIGKGKVVVVADADFLNANAMESYGGVAESQLSQLMRLLETLETR
jgi:hypothetical protein